MNQKTYDMTHSRNNFNNIVKPLLMRIGFSKSYIDQLKVRIEWTGKDHANFTLRLSDNNPNDVPEIEQIVRSIQAGLNTEVHILQAYVSKKESGYIMSLGIMPATQLAYQMANKIGTYDKIHPIESVPFRCLFFKNIIGLSFKYPLEN